MKKIDYLRAVSDRSALAKLLEFTPKGMSYVLYKLGDAEKYRKFSIKKKSGGQREICAPTDRLKLLQKRLARLLRDCVVELEGEQGHRIRVSHGFVKGRNILTNASSHTNNRYVLNVDIEDFFGTINFGRVRGFFIKDKNFQLSEEVATCIAQIACFENSLPQGGPASPVISNLIMRILDVRLARLAKDNGAYYTRYADDLTFSTNQKRFPKKIARRNLLRRNEWSPGSVLKNEIKAAGFSLNSKKTRMLFRQRRQDVTGLVVNDKPNVPNEFYRYTRAMCNSYFRFGKYHYFARHHADEDGPVETEDPAHLRGRLSYLYYIKARRDRSIDENKRLEFRPPQALSDLYKKFLYFDYFVNNRAPFIITEGKTDVTYLKQAVKLLAPEDELLSKEHDGRRVCAVRFLKPKSFINNALLGLGSGTGQMQEFYKTYHKWISGFPYAPMNHPVIVFVDNDQGSTKLLNMCNSNVAEEISLASEKQWYHLNSNLYLLKTPVLNGGASSSEDLFSASILSRKVSGKSFDPTKDDENATSFGKHIFADRVVRQCSDPAELAGWQSTLDSLKEIIEDFRTKKAESSVMSTAKQSA